MQIFCSNGFLIAFFASIHKKGTGGERGKGKSKMPSKVQILLIIWVGKNVVGQPHVHLLNMEALSSQRQGSLPGTQARF